MNARKKKQPIWKYEEYIKYGFEDYEKNSVKIESKEAFNSDGTG